jgi:protein TonB
MAMQFTSLPGGNRPDADGRVSSSRIEQSSGSRDLDRAAINVLTLCRFKPATNNGVAEAGWARLAFVWKLD